MPEVVPIPDELADPEVIRNRGQWAGKFRGGTTNLSLRARHVEDEAAYVGQLQEKQEALQRENLARNKGEQTLFFNSKRLERQERLADNQILHRDKMFARTEAFHEESERAKQAALEFKAEAETLKRAQTANFSARASEALKTFGLGTPEYARAIAQARLEHPGADSAVFDDAWKTTNSRLQPEQVIENFKKVQSLASTATVSATATGSTTITQRPGAETAPLERERDFLLGLREKAKARLAKEDDPAKQAIHKGDLDEYEQRLSETTSKLEATRKPAVPGAPSATALPDITRDEYEKLPTGATFWHGGRQLTKK